ncbi:hypothetical protein RRG08_019864, partial [Elysia crispata]
RRKDEPPAVEEFGIKLGELPQYTAEAGATGELSWQKERPVGEWEKRAPSDRVGRDINQYGWGGITASGSNLLDSRFPDRVSPYPRHAVSDGGDQTPSPCNCVRLSTTYGGCRTREVPDPRLNRVRVSPCFTKSLKSVVSQG